MPATRTRPSSQHRSRHSPTRNLPGRPEVVVLSSDSENARPSEIGSSRSKKKTIKKLTFPMREVLEISSSDEEPVLPKAPGNDGSSWQRENLKLKQINEHLERKVAHQRAQLHNSRKRFEEQRQEIVAQSREIDAGLQEIKLQQEKLAALQAKGKSKSVDATELGDMLSCDICAHLMHSPYLLSDCGHCYCEGCLKGWFDETLTKHTRAHPTYDVNRKLVPPNFPQVLQSINPRLSYPIQTQLQAVCNASRRQQPEYTCPGCRQEITRKPVLNFVVRDMVSLVGSAFGQPDTRRESSGQRAGPFDAFSPE
ncbi:hypothetical protein CY34DRAFT_807282 [Suillus luteus UH-Slu-Lm8-n1]|uniref:Zinc finger RING-type eukaryotic domain-containing protein n=1 Tax=Suillus luteus UH-Slu-Lm8-n1 TaxID=930992 RepID=A0A0D0B9H8_9AGAM|nr:hypothetical protein CY34DRAFT_807282 [Suillus luteus UH-Slu-Lm8-n1]